MHRRTLLAAGLAAPALLRARAARAATPVDVELILAVDVSRSVDEDELKLQFEGYAEAFRDPRLAEGIAGGPLGAIAVMLFTWSGENEQRTLIPWQHLDGPTACQGFAAAVERAPRESLSYTSISGAIDYATQQFGRGFEGTRQVVDISGDGISNAGRPLSAARAEALARGIVLNGLVVLDQGPAAARALETHYREEVIGGPGAFLVVAEGYPAFAAAVRRKIIREVAGLPGPRTERSYG